LEKNISQSASDAENKEDLLKILSESASKKLDAAEDEDFDIWYELVDFFELEAARLKPFKQPDVLRYISKLQEHLAQSGLVGKSNSVADIVKKVHQELIDGKLEPDDLWHMVTIDYMHTNIWMQLPSGDNKDMEKVVKEVEEFFSENPPPVPLEYNWAGLTYINTVWQNKMVWGMLQSFMGSFIIVFIMMAILFRSPLWGIVCMVPLLITIVVIYGIIGLAGKDYDMPVAVLSALTLGMAVDFAIHFLERARAEFTQTGSWQKSVGLMFGDPAKAISRNVLVIAIGFLPLLAAPLIPYKTVGIFLCAIMALSGAVTLLALPAILKLLEKVLFKGIAQPKAVTCNCGFCLIISIAITVLLAINLKQYWQLGWSKMAVLSLIAIPIMVLSCGIMSRRQACKTTDRKENEIEQN
jgi:predicted RND superfamily exporter protein